jgi:hypothetical protein
VSATFTQNVYTVSTQVTSGIGSISPTSVNVNHGATAEFTITPDPLYVIGTVGGTCGGSLAGDTYTTSGITAPCTVEVTFDLIGGTGGFTQGIGFGSLGALSFLFNNTLFGRLFGRKRKQTGKE